jgi:hypothetical protein
VLIFGKGKQIIAKKQKIGHYFDNFAYFETNIADFENSDY